MTGLDTPLHIEVTTDSVVVTGELDAHTVALLAEALRSLPNAGEARLDLAGVTFIDSSGMRSLLDGHQQMAADGRRLILLRPSTSVTRLLQITGLTGHLYTEPPIETPVASAT